MKTSNIKTTPHFDTGKDLVSALLIVSVIVNIFVLTAWITIEVSPVYSAQALSYFNS